MGNPTDLSDHEFDVVPTCKIEGLPNKVKLKPGEFTEFAKIEISRVQTSEDLTVKFTK